MTQFVDFVALGWVEKSLREEVEAARNCLHRYQREPDQLQHLKDAERNMHAASGVLRLCALAPAVLLTEEIERVLHQLHAGDISGDERKLAMTELVAAIEAIPAYMARVRTNREVSVGSVATAVNELRHYSKRPQLPESLYFDPPVAAGAGVSKQQEEISETELKTFATTAVESCFTHSQAALDGDATALEALGRLAREAASQLKGSAMEPYFACYEGLLQGLASGDTQPDEAVVDVFLHCFSFLHQLATQGKGALSKASPAPQLKKMLYYVARMQQPTQEQQTLLEAFAITDVEEHISVSAGRLIQEDDLLEALQQPLQQLTKIMDFLTTSGQEINRNNLQLIESILPGLRQVGLQLKVLGLDEQANSVDQQHKILEGYALKSATTSPAEMVDFGAALITVREVLEFKMQHGFGATGNGAAQDLDRAIAEQVLRCLADMKESINREFVRQGLLDFSKQNPARLDVSIAGLRPLFRAARMAGDQGILTAMQNWEEDGFPDPETLQAIANDLMLQFQDTELAQRAVVELNQVLNVFDLLESKHRESGVLRECADFVAESLDLGGLVNDASMSCFAETIAALEQFLEASNEDPREDAEQHLARAEERAADLDSFTTKRAKKARRAANIVDFESPAADSRHGSLLGGGNVLNFHSDAIHTTGTTVPAELVLTLRTGTENATAAVVKETMQGESETGTDAIQTSTGGTQALPWRGALEHWASTAIARAPEAPAEGPEASFDDELRECFVEECSDYISRLQDTSTDFAADPTSVKLIGDIRTIFHTMKGSARTIELNEFGDFMHDMEAIFNNLRDGYIEGSAKLAEFVSVVSRQLPGYMELISQRVPLLAEDFAVPNAIATAVNDKQFGDELTVEVTISTDQAVATEALVYSAEIWPSAAAQDIVSAVTARLDSMPSVEQAVLAQAHQLGAALAPALVEMREAGLLDLDEQLFSYFIALSHMQHLASGAIYGMVEADNGEQSKLAISDDTTANLRDYLDQVSTVEGGDTLHQAAQSLLQSALELPVVDEVREVAEEMPMEEPVDISNVVAFRDPAQQAQEDLVADIDEELLDLFIETMDEYTESIDSAVASLAGGDTSALRDLKNTLHTVKGAANSVGLRSLGRFVHDFESALVDLEHDSSISNQDAVAAIDTLVGEFSDATQYVRINKVDWDEVAKAQYANQKDSDDNAQDAAAQPEEGKTDTLRIKTHKIDRLLDMGLEISMSNVRCRQALDSAAQERNEVQGLARRVLALVDKLSLQLDTEIQAKTESMPEGEQFDPLEMDRITEKQSLAAILREAAYDLQEEAGELGQQLNTAIREAQSSTRLLQTNQSDLRLMRLVNFSKLGPGLRRLVHQVSRQLGKQVEFDFTCGEGGLDIGAFEQIRVALEHMLRNAIDHGIGTPEERVAQGKAETGNIRLSISRQGSEFVIRLIDDGSGMDPDVLRTKAMDLGLLQKMDAISDADALRLVFNAGFTTARSLTDVSGRGVGMDVVYQSITQAGGSVNVQSKAGFYTQFDVRVPASIMVNGALLATVQDEQVAVPLTSLKGSEFHRRDDVLREAADREGSISFRGEDYEVRYLGTVRNNLPLPAEDMMADFVPVMFAQHGRRRVAFFADALDNAEEMVIRSLGAQYTGVPGVAGGAIKPDGQAVLALDLNEFVLQVDHADQRADSTESTRDEAKFILCVDDSVMMRRTYEKRLGSLGYKVHTAVDGEDALDFLSETARMPDFIFTDLEMPNMNGFEFIANLRRVPRMKHIPTVVVSSRDAEKHRTEAQRAGASGFMAKGSNSTEGMQAVIEQHLGAEALAS